MQFTCPCDDDDDVYSFDDWVDDFGLASNAISILHSVPI